MSASAMARKAAGSALALAGIAGVALTAWLALPSLSGPHETFDKYVEEASFEEGGEEQVPAIDWEALRATNPDVVGWIRVSGTGIDCPIVQARSSDPEKYLSHALDGSPSAAGCPYVDASSEKAGLLDFAPYVWGHSLVDGTMFSDFRHMGDPSYAADHSSILLLTPDWQKELRVCCVEVVDADATEKTTGIATVEEASAELARAAASSAVVLDVPSAANRVWRFVTCSYQTDNSRTVVYAVEA